MSFYRTTVGIALGAVGLLAGALACGPSTPATVEQEVEVTRVVEQTVPVTRERLQLVKVTRIVEQTVEVTKIVQQPVEVTREVESTVEVTRQVPVTVVVTATPLPTATVVQRIKPAHDWSYDQTNRDPITGLNVRNMVTTGEMIDEADSESYDEPRLVLRCNGDDFQAFTDWGGRYLEADPVTNTIPGTARVDGKQQRSRDMDGRPAEDGEGLFFLKPRAIVREVLNGESLVFRITNANNTMLTAQFPVAGLHTQLHLLPCH